ncbi:hypothetical protein [Devosia yakushimensis]|uniref:hypothetical protein n=1 Tax=Devosia yakushimensis TaxID=470028 RepID=UPI0024E08933|nr:hypothetical protein [Devosia yakushimensis]
MLISFVPPHCYGALETNRLGSIEKCSRNSTLRERNSQKAHTGTQVANGRIITLLAIDPRSRSIVGLCGRDRRGYLAACALPRRGPDANTTSATSSTVSLVRTIVTGIFRAPLKLFLADANIFATLVARMKACHS